MTVLRILPFLLLASLWLGGCVVYPVPPGNVEGYRANVGDGVPSFIKPGKTTREDVIMLLGEPDGVGQDDSWLMYGNALRMGGVGLVVAVPGGASGAIGQMWWTKYSRLILVFDAKGIFTRSISDSKKCSSSWSASSGSTPGTVRDDNSCMSNLEISNIPSKYRLLPVRF